MPQVIRPLERQIVELTHAHARQCGAVARTPAPCVDAGANPQAAGTDGREERRGDGHGPLQDDEVHWTMLVVVNDCASLRAAADVVHHRRGLYRSFCKSGPNMFRLFPQERLS